MAKVVVEEGIKVVTTGAGNPLEIHEMENAGIKVIPVVASPAVCQNDGKRAEPMP